MSKKQSKVTKHPPLEKTFQPDIVEALQRKRFHGISFYELLSQVPLSKQEYDVMVWTAYGQTPKDFTLSSQAIDTIMARVKTKINRYRTAPPEKDEFDDMLPICHEARESWDRNGRLLFTEEEARVCDQIGERKSRRQICLALHISGKVLDEHLSLIRRKQGERQALIKAHEEYIDQEHEKRVNPILDLLSVRKEETTSARLYGQDPELKLAFPIEGNEEGGIQDGGYRVVSSWTRKGKGKRSEEEMRKREEKFLDKK